MPSTGRHRVVLHRNPAQGEACLGGLVQYADAISGTEMARSWPSADAFVRWCLSQPVKLDLGEGPQVSGCSPAQRSRIWPDDGLNCWEATAHYLGVVQALGLPLEVHVYDRDIGNMRHVFPAVRAVGGGGYPQPVILQHGATVPGRRGQAWYNDLLGAVHVVGTAALSAFGMGGVAAAVERAESGTGELPAWAHLQTAPPRVVPPVPVAEPDTATPLVYWQGENAEPAAAAGPEFEDAGAYLAAMSRAQGIDVQTGPQGRPIPGQLWLGGFTDAGEWKPHGPYDWVVAASAIHEAQKKPEPIWIWDPGVNEWRRVV